VIYLTTNNSDNPTACRSAVELALIAYEAVLKWASRDLQLPEGGNGRSGLRFGPMSMDLMGNGPAPRLSTCDATFLARQVSEFVLASPNPEVYLAELGIPIPA
jgi:hypothetical protein